MCELRVTVNGRIVFENAIYAKATENSVVVRDVLGNTRQFSNHIIAEVDITKEKMALSPKQE